MKAGLYIELGRFRMLEVSECVCALFKRINLLFIGLCVFRFGSKQTIE